MENQSVMIEQRQKAVEWLNSKDRSFDKGISILKEAGYKPHVTANLEKNRNRRDVPGKLLREIRLFIRYCVHPDAPEHEDEPPFVNPEEKQDANIQAELSKEYPPVIKKLLSEHSDLYKGRSIMHKDLKAVGENNDEKSAAQRQRLGVMIDASSRRMDILWKAFDEYKQSGTLPEESLFEKPFNPEDSVKAKTEDNSENKLFIPESVEELKKLSENLRIKIRKGENRLEYRQETIGDKPDPMPDGPKRVKQEKRIENFKKHKEAVDLKLAELS
jgi:hypothetical protein